jgi:DnaJ-class molecular chaperone
MPKLGAERTGEGAPAARGDLYVRIKVRLPEKLDEKERKLFEELKALGV